jgi:hypothetical protein
MKNERNLKKTLLGCALAVLLAIFAAGYAWGEDESGPQKAFNAAYWAAKAPAVRGLSALRGEARQLKARELAETYAIDAAIDAWGMDPYWTMRLRKEYGYTWVPSALQPPVSIAPGLAVPGITPYDPKTPPPGSIRVSLDAADFPPYDPPPAPAPPATGYQPASPATYEQLPGIWITPGGDNWPAGAEILRPDGTRLVKIKRGTGWRTFEYWQVK